MSRWENFTEEEKIEAGEAAYRLVNSADWTQSLGPWLEGRIELLRSKIDTMPIDNEEERKNLHLTRQELAVWKRLLTKPQELIANAEGLADKRQGTQGEVTSG